MATRTTADADQGTDTFWDTHPAAHATLWCIHHGSTDTRTLTAKTMFTNREILGHILTLAAHGLIDYWKEDNYPTDMEENPYYRRKKEAAITERNIDQLARIDAIDLRDALPEHVIGDYRALTDYHRTTTTLV